MSPEKHLANILMEWNKTDGNILSPELHAALAEAEADFDGVEAGQ